MNRSTIVKTLLPFAVIALSAIIGLKYTQSVSAAFHGAIYTTRSDGTQVNQNLFAAKADVYLNGGPQNQNANGLPDGQYFYQVTNPSGSVLLSEDNADCRRLKVVGGVVAGSVNGVACAGHANGSLNPVNGSTPVQLIPFANTPNNGGEYKVWLIRQASTTTIDGANPKVLHFNNDDAKTDNFKIKENCETNPDLPICNPDTTEVTLSGHKFYDANANSIDDDGGLDVAGVQIVIAITTPAGPLPPVTVTTDVNGDWTYGPIPAGSTYVVSENLPCIDENNDQVCDVGHYWVQTAPVADSTGFQGYSGTANANVTGLDFGDVCFEPATGGLTLGYWSNKNGKKTMESLLNVNVNAYPTPADNPAFPFNAPGMNGDLAFLSRLNLKGEAMNKKTTMTVDFDPTSYTGFNTWILSANAYNMSYMLSAQLAATSLDVRHNSLSDSQVVDARTICNSLGSCLGFVTIGEVRVLADQSLGAGGGNKTISGDPQRDSQELMKNFLDAVNNNRLPFASAQPCTVFYPPPAQ